MCRSLIIIFVFCSRHFEILTHNRNAPVTTNITIYSCFSCWGVFLDNVKWLILPNQNAIIAYFMCFFFERIDTVRSTTCYEWPVKYVSLQINIGFI